MLSKVKSFFFSFFIVSVLIMLIYNMHWQSQNYMIGQTKNKLSSEFTVVDFKVDANNKNISSKSLEHIKCLALNMYYEARGEPFLGQIAVSRVVMNRVKSSLFPNDPCKVIYQSHKVERNENIVTICQFSWVCDDLRSPIVKSIYKDMEKIAKQVLLHDRWEELLPEDVLFFHASYVRPGWSKVHLQFATIGNHIFYESKK